MNRVMRKTVAIVAVLLPIVMAVFAPADGAVPASSASGPSNPERIRLLREAPVVAGKGEAEMKAYARANNASITPEIIEEIGEQGKKEKKENLLILARILAEEKNDAKSIAETLVRHGDYYQQLSRTSESMGMYGKALRMFEALKDDASQGEVYIHMGDSVLSNADKNEAISFYSKALPLLVKADHQKGIGNVYARMGLIRFNAGDINGAKVWYEKAITLFEKADDKEDLRYLYMWLGNIHLTNGDIPRTRELFEKALPMFSKEENPKEVGQLSLTLGGIYKRENRSSKAKELLELSIAAFSRSDDPGGLGTAHRFMGDLQQIGNPAKAEDEYRKALQFLAQAHDLKSQGEVCLDIGFLQFAIVGNYLKAKEWYEKALHYFVDANDLGGQGAAYRGLGEIQAFSGNNQKALELFEKALPLVIKANRTNDELMLNQSMALIYKEYGNNAKALELFERCLSSFDRLQSPMNDGSFFTIMADIHLQAGNSAKATELYDKALSCYVRANNKKGQGEIYQKKGDIFLEKGDTAHAQYMYEKALSFFTELDYRIGQGIIRQCMGKMWVKSGNDAKAMDQFEKALQVLTAKESDKGPLVHYVLMSIYMEMAEIHKRTGNNTMVLEVLDKLLESNSRMGDVPLINSYIFIKKGFALQRSGKSVEAVKLFDRAIEQIENTRRLIGLDEFKKYWMTQTYSASEKMALFMIGNGYNEKAFRYAESMKARLFLDQLAEGRVDLEKGISPDLKKQRDGLEQELNGLNTNLQAELNRKEPDEKRAEAIRKKYRKKEAALEELKNTIRLRNPLYAQVEYPQPVNVTDLQHNTLRPNEVLLEYFIAESAIYRFMISRDSYDVIKLPITRDELDKGIASLKAHVSDPGNASRTVLPLAADKTARRLYNALIAPGMEAFADKTLIIVPDGVMATLPFEILKSGDRYAIEKHNLVYVQSASVLATLRAHQARNGASGFIGFGDPVYDYENFKTGKPEKVTIEQQRISYADMVRGSYLERGGVLSRLPGSGEEVKAIAALFSGKGDQAASNLRLDAREEKARSTDMERYGYIHFATHGILNDQLQAIALSQIPESGTDGFLTVGKLMNSRYNARLVVLSACRTGEGKLERGEGVTGLTRAVMYAGSPAAVVSLWSVSDEGTKELMTKMYRTLLNEGKSPGDSLRGAKLAMLRERTYAAPYYWAAFVMYGE